MENRSLGGFGFLAGNAALFTNGLIAALHADTPQSRKAGMGRMASSALWSGSAGLLARYGDRSVDAQLDRLEHKLSAYLKQHNVPLDAESLKKADAETQRGWFAKLEDFIYDHPLEVSNAYTALASTGFLASGLWRRSDGNIRAGNANIGVSALVLAGTLASILIPEKTEAQLKEEGKQGTITGAVQKQPLNYIRWVFMGSDALAGMEALGEYQSASHMPKGQPYRKWQFGMAALSACAMGMFLASDWITGAGSKKASGKAEDREKAQEALLKTSAEHLMKLPPAERQAMAEQAAMFLSHQNELRLLDIKPKDLAAKLLQYAEEKARPAHEAGTHVSKLQQNAGESSLRL